MKLSVVIPVFNSQATIQQLVYSLFSTLREYNLEVVLVNDASRDNSEAICEALADENEHIQFVSLRKNSGEHNAVMCGLNYCTGDYVAIVDDDFQNPPSEVAVLLNKAVRGEYDVVYGRYVEKKHSFKRNLYSWLNNAVTVYLLKKPKGLYLSSFKIIKREVVRELIAYKGPFPYIDALVLRSTDNIGVETVRHADRATGRSNYTFRKLFSLYLNMFINFSFRPLRIITIAGFIISLISFVMSIYILIEKFILRDAAPKGWYFLAILLLFMIGLVFIVIGVLGEYIGKILMALNNTPQFVVKKEVNTKQDRNSDVNKVVYSEA